MKLMAKAAAATIAALVLTTVPMASASADEDTWTYWGDGISSGTGERSSSFTTKNEADPCVVTLRVKRYPDLATASGWLEPTAEAVCRSTRRSGTGMALRISANGEAVPLAMVPSDSIAELRPNNRLNVNAKYTETRGRVCFTAKATANGGTGSANICGTW